MFDGIGLGLRPQRMLQGVAIALVVLAAIASSAGARVPAARPFIQGGTEHYLPYLARISGETTEGGFSCSGTVIAPSWVLTAGHCVGKPEESGAKTFPASDFKVYTGNVNWEKANVSTVSEALRDPGYTFALFKSPQLDVVDDVGLLHLSSPVAVEPITLASPASFASRVVEGAVVSAAGFGLTEPQGIEPSKTMQLVTGLDVESLPGPGEAGENNDVLIGSNQEKGTCEGDSGGPFIDSTGEEIATTSFGPANACNSTDAQRIDKVDPWIEEHVQATESPAVSSISPASGPAGTQIVIHGTGMAKATAVSFGKKAATSFSIVSADELKATAPSGKGTVDVTVTNANATSPAVAGDKFEYTKAVKGPKPKDYTLCVALEHGPEECFETPPFEVFTKTHTWKEREVTGTYTSHGKDYVFNGEERGKKFELVGVKGKKGVIAGEVNFEGYPPGYETFSLTPQ